MVTPRLGHLLVVDDEIDVMTSLCEILSEVGYETRGFTSGKDALKALKEQTFDLLLTDLVMPKMDGVTLLKAALELDPNLVGIIITAKGTIQTAIEAMKAGAFDYILKPFKLNTLLLTLSRAIDVRRLREAEERYRSIVEDQTELICRFMPDSVLTFVNEAFCRYFGKKREELLGHSFIILIPDEDHEKVKRHLLSLNRGYPVATHEHRVINRNGEICWQQWTDRAIFNRQGDLIEFQVVGRDVTDRKHMEEELKKRVEELERFYEMAVSRELKIKELKKEIESLKDELSRYKSVSTRNQKDEAEE